jgi:antitoxin component of MazEF toxin-antitoxin module
MMVGDLMTTAQISETTKLVAHGKQLALLLDPEMLRAMGIDETTPVSIKVVGGSIVVAPAPVPTHRQQFEVAKQDTFKKYDSVLKKLAE